MSGRDDLRVVRTATAHLRTTSPYRTSESFSRFHITTFSLAERLTVALNRINTWIGILVGLATLIYLILRIRKKPKR